MKTRLVSAICILVLAPLLPFWLLQKFGDALSVFAEWCVEDRAWAKPFVEASERVEWWLLYRWRGTGPEPKSWYAPDGTKVYRSYEDYCD